MKVGIAFLTTPFLTIVGQFRLILGVGFDGFRGGFDGLGVDLMDLGVAVIDLEMDLMDLKDLMELGLVLSGKVSSGKVGPRMKFGIHTSAIGTTYVCMYVCMHVCM